MEISEKEVKNSRTAFLEILSSSVGFIVGLILLGLNNCQEITSRDLKHT